MSQAERLLDYKKFWDWKNAFSSNFEISGLRGNIPLLVYRVSAIRSPVAGPTERIRVRGGLSLLERDMTKFQIKEWSFFAIDQYYSHHTKNCQSICVFVWDTPQNTCF
jgi:hypothetical protein